MFENFSRAACACGAASRPCRESLAPQALLRIRGLRPPPPHSRFISKLRNNILFYDTLQAKCQNNIINYLMKEEPTWRA